MADSVADRRDRFMLLRITTNNAAEVQLSDIIELAKLAMPVVGTSVSTERAFAAVSFVNAPEKNAVNKHLEIAVRAKDQGWFTYTTFTNQEGLTEWHDAAAVRGRYKAK